MKELKNSQGEKSKGSLFGTLSQYFILLPRVPHPAGIRHRIADGLFIALLTLSRVSFLIGGYIGAHSSEEQAFKACLAGGAIGWLFGWWMRRSLGVRHRDLTHGYFVRLFQRGSGDPVKWLEGLLESLRGCRFTLPQCRIVAGAYAEIRHQLWTSESPDERQQLLRRLDRKVMATLYPGSSPQESDAMELDGVPAVSNAAESS